MNKQPLIFLNITAIVLGVGVSAWYLASRPSAGAPSAATASASASAGKGGGQVTTVSLAIAARQDVPIVLQANGTVVPLSSVDLHAQTTSIIKQVHIQEGQTVRKDDLLFSLDDRNERANLDKAEAQLARDAATLSDLERQHKRSLQLIDQHFISQGAADTLASQVAAQAAAVKADKAALHATQIALSYDTIRAPMGGRVGAINVYAGSLVQLSTSLLTITQQDPIALSFTLPESSLQALFAAQRAGDVPVRASVSNSGNAGSGGSGAAKSAKVQNGVLSFVDNSVDPQAGTIRVKAKFDNHDSQLWPGQYADASITLQTLKDAVVVPLAAIIANTSGKFVYVMAADQSAKSVPVAVLYVFGVNAAVSGLSGGEKIIVDGKQNLRPGGKVREAEKNPNGFGKAGKDGAGRKTGKDGDAKAADGKRNDAS